MDSSAQLAIAGVVSLSVLVLVLLSVAIRRVIEPQPTAEISLRRMPNGSLRVMDRHDRVAYTIALDGGLRQALYKLRPLKLRLLALRFGLVDGDRLSRADVAWVLHRSEEEVEVIESYALAELGPQNRASLEHLRVPRHRLDTGGDQTSGRPVPLKPAPPSLSAASEADLPEPTD
jgi:hypothetical protein